jgi:hypothetical protein
MEDVFEKIWTESNLNKSDEKLKQVCKKTIETYLLAQEVSNIRIVGPYPECSTREEDLTFDIRYLFVDKECFMQINYSSDSEACQRNIPDSIGIQ